MQLIDLQKRAPVDCFPLVCLLQRPLVVVLFHRLLPAMVLFLVSLLDSDYSSLLKFQSHSQFYHL